MSRMDLIERAGSGGATSDQLRLAETAGNPGKQEGGILFVGYQIGNNRGRINGWVTAKSIFGRCISIEPYLHVLL